MDENFEPDFDCANFFDAEADGADHEPEDEDYINLIDAVFCDDGNVVIKLPEIPQITLPLMVLEELVEEPWMIESVPITQESKDQWKELLPMILNLAEHKIEIYESCGLKW